MKIGEAIAKKGSSLSFEFFPPKTKPDEDRLMDTIGQLESFRPAFVSVTYGAGGGMFKNTRALVKRIQDSKSLTVMPHLTCIDQDEDELKNILTDYRRLGVENILALRGDPPRGTTFSPSVHGFCYAKDLIKIIRPFGAFSIGVAVYPEGHSESPDLDTDMAHTKEKIDAGADFAITQMFFDNTFFYRFRERATRAGISVPLIPGIMPITDLERIKKFSQMCGATLPRKLVERMEKEKSPQEAARTGLNLAIEQCRDLRENGVRYFHFYSLNRADAVSTILRGLN